MKKVMMLSDFEHRVVQRMREVSHKVGYDVKRDWRQVNLVMNFAVEKDRKSTGPDTVKVLVDMRSLAATLREPGVPDATDQKLDVELVHVMENQCRTIRLGIPEAFRKDAVECKDETVEEGFQAAPEAAT